jgi:putative Ca2+/H+ antiporter (TMEM165/GDT1 family)
MILVMEPMTIVGAVVGGILNKLLPVWLTTVLLTALLIVMAQKLWVKASSMYRKENEALQQPTALYAPEHTEENHLQGSHPVVCSPCLYPTHY